jgi:hypothetical protein
MMPRVYTSKRLPKSNRKNYTPYNENPSDSPIWRFRTHINTYLELDLPTIVWRAAEEFSFFSVLNIFLKGK